MPISRPRDKEVDLQTLRATHTQGTEVFPYLAQIYFLIVQRPANSYHNGILRNHSHKAEEEILAKVQFNAL